MKLRPYPEYKDSGVPWLGKIPVHWDGAKLGRIGKTFKTGPFGSILHQSDYVSNGIPIVNPAHMIRGRIRPNPHRTITPDTFERLREYGLEENDIVFSRRGELGRCALVTSREHGYLLGTGSIRVRLREDMVNPEYLLTSYQAQWVGDLLSSLSVGATMESLNTGILRQLPAIIPPVDEQTQIARFLDWKAAQINKFIRNKRRLIELLKEQKQNIINQAVMGKCEVRRVKGENGEERLEAFPTSPFKLRLSGVEWIGDVPEHWEARKLKFASKMIVGGATPASGQSELWDGDVVWVTPQDVSKNERLSSSARKLTSAGFASCSTVMVPPGGVVVTSRAPVGNVSFAEVDLCTNQGCKAVVPDERYLLNEYCFVLLKVMQPAFQRAANGTTFFEISTWAFENIKAPLPPTSEQEAILAQIKEATSKINQAITRAGREIELMREYRTRLISDVVTGQVDVRNVKCEGGSLKEDEIEDIEEVEEEIELPEGGEDDE